MEWFARIGSILPITVVAAVTLFVVKEIWEFVKKARADHRKRSAIHQLISIELEINKWVLRSIADAAGTIERSQIESSGKLTIRKTNSGVQRLEFHSKDGELSSSMPLPPVKKEVISKYLLDVAMIDSNAFPDVLEASSALSELEHLRDTVINSVEDTIVMDVFVEGLIEYLRDSARDVESTLGILYEKVAGKKYESSRVR